MKNPSRQIVKSKKVEHFDSDEELESSSYSSEEEEEEEEIERELADATFEELQKARSNGSHSVYGKNQKEKKVGRANKNRPMETSCKKPVSRFRDVIQAPKKVIRDPRFESLCGTLDADGFKKRYNFLYEEKLPAEKEELYKQLKKSRDPKVIEELQNRLSWISKQLLKSDTSKQREKAILAEHKKKEREAAKQGKKPFYLKKSEIRKIRLLEKYEELKTSRPGKLEAYIHKRREKNAAKDHRYLPYRRPKDNEQQS